MTPIWLAPLDVDLIVESVARTGRLLVVDNGWTTAGMTSEIMALVAERLSSERRIPMKRMGFARTTCPPTPALEELFYPNAQTIAAAALDLVYGEKRGWLPQADPALQEIEFKGPF